MRIRKDRNRRWASLARLGSGDFSTPIEEYHHQQQQPPNTNSPAFMGRFGSGPNPEVQGWPNDDKVQTNERN